MNINAIRAETRNLKVLEILNTIKKVFSQGNTIDKEKLVNECCFNQKVTRRTAREYLEIALSQIDFKIIKIDKKDFLVPITYVSNEEKINSLKSEDVLTSPSASEKSCGSVVNESSTLSTPDSKIQT